MASPYKHAQSKDYIAYLEKHKEMMNGSVFVNDFRNRTIRCKIYGCIIKLVVLHCHDDHENRRMQHYKSPDYQAWNLYPDQFCQEQEHEKGVPDPSHIRKFQ